MIIQLTVPTGADALLDPVTVAVKSNDPPKVVEPVTPRLIVGVATFTRVEFEEVTVDTGLYAASPGKVNDAL